MSSIRRYIPRFQNKYNADNLAVSRSLFIMDGMIAMMVGTVVGGSYLSGFLEHIGTPASLNGLVNAIPVLVALAQVFGALLSNRVCNDKLITVIGATIFRFGYALMYILALRLSGISGLVTVFTLFFVSSAIGSFITPAANLWLVAIAPPQSRGRYMGFRDSLSMIFTAVSLIGIGILLDHFADLGQTGKGFVYVGIFIAVCTAINAVGLSNIQRPPPVPRTEHIKILELIRLPFLDKDFRPILMLCVLFQVATQIGGAYWGLYLVSNAGLSYSFISTITFITMFQRSVFVNFWGRLADKTSWRFVLQIMFVVLAIGNAMSAFVVKENAVVMYPLTSFITSIAWSGMGISLFNIQFQYAPPKNTQMFVGINSALNGVLGFFAALIGGAVMLIATPQGFQFSSVTITGQQVLMGISGLMFLATFVYLTAAFSKDKAPK